MQSLTLRQPSRQEIARLSELGKLLFTQTFAGLYSQADENAFLNRVYSIDGIAHDWDSGCEFWIAEEQQTGSWVAYSKSGPVKVPAHTVQKQRPPLERCLELRQLYVHRDYHRYRIGTRMMEKFLDRCKREHVQCAYISCWSENKSALAFYGRFGFHPIGSYDFPVGEKVDIEYILCRSFTDRD